MKQFTESAETTKLDKHNLLKSLRSLFISAANTVQMATAEQIFYAGSGLPAQG